ncbi:MAG: N-formylglutamate amidohydrolase [Paenibacillaceae bacterium]|nr:N-formylglutamate amidohydrolase [Paenibacillaceae bacterium]
MHSLEVKRSNPISAIIASIPHGSSQITTEMIKSMKPDIVLPNNDWLLNELYSFLEGLNITTVSANYSRYVIDVNRNIRLKNQSEDYTKSLVYQKTTFGRDIYDIPLSEDTIMNRIENIYVPYHYRLSEEINASLAVNRKVFLVDLHSFYIQSAKDVVLGTCQGKSCSSEFLEAVRSAFVEEGFTVSVDEKGLSGGYIVSKYGSLNSVEAIQIELRYTKYIENREFGEEEATKKNDELFKETQIRLFSVFQNIKTLIT